MALNSSSGPVKTGAGGSVGTGTEMDAQAKANAVSPAGEGAETEVDLTELLMRMTTACVVSAQRLQDQMAQPPWRDSPVVYTIPKMKISMKVALSSTKTQVKGILWWKTQQGTTAESLSQIELEIVAVPGRSE
jgi:hypothetical protein